MLTTDKRLFIAAAEDPARLVSDGRELDLNARMGNRHGLITGATGTGKTITLQNLAESFSALGVPVLLTDIKGDLSGVCKPGAPGGSIAARIEELGLRSKGYENRGYPVCFWDVHGQQGHPLRATISDMGPMLLARLLELNDVQSGILNIVFRVADDNGLLLLDLKDLRAMVAFVAENRAEYTTKYGNISPASVGALQRALLRLEDEGAEAFFGEPALNIEDLFRTDLSGRGYLNIVAADKLMQTPRLYASVLLWMLSELYEQMPEVGDCDKPRLVLMFDEAHLLFDDMPEALLEKIEQVVRLIRSKGVGVYFITQNPADVPDTVLSQLGNRVQHALRAFTPRDQKAVRAAAQTFRANPAMDTETVISELRTGEALVSFLDRKGAPSMVERALVLPPEGGIGPISPEERQEIIARSPMNRLYGVELDRESAYELLAEHTEQRQREAEEAEAEKARIKEENALRKAQLEAERLARAEAREARLREKEERQRKKAEQGILGDFLDLATKQTTRTITNTIGREIGRTLIRGVLGSLFGKR
ncbi:MAG: DUF853 family protein [Mailhella sp.]|nr:DUF853 family protein [Mailhella sp.]